jgi:hypothetical protein
MGFCLHIFTTSISTQKTTKHRGLSTEINQCPFNFLQLTYFHHVYIEKIKIQHTAAYTASALNKLDSALCPYILCTLTQGECIISLSRRVCKRVNLCVMPQQLLSAKTGAAPVYGAGAVCNYPVN